MNHSTHLSAKVLSGNPSTETDFAYQLSRFACQKLLDSQLTPGRSDRVLVAARLHHIAGTRWGTKRYLDMKRFEELEEEKPIAEELAFA